MCPFRYSMSCTVYMWCVRSFIYFLSCTLYLWCVHLDTLRNGRFHNNLRDLFAPLVVRYVDLMESSIGQSIHNGFEKETWKPQGLVFMF